MVALARNVVVGTRGFKAGTDHTAMPVWAVDEIRDPQNWAGGVVPALSEEAPEEPVSLSGLTPTQIRTVLGVSSGPGVTVGTTDGTVAAGNDSRIVGAAQKAQNLSDLGSASTARTNLGLGGAATRAVGTTANTVAAGDDVRFPVTTGAMVGDVPKWDGTKLVMQRDDGGPITVRVTAAALPNAGVFVSDPYDRDQPYPGRSFATARFTSEANASYTVRQQTSVDGTTWPAVDAANGTHSTLLTVTSSGGKWTVDSSTTPTVRYLRWVITATAAGMTTMKAEAVLS